MAIDYLFSLEGVGLHLVEVGHDYLSSSLSFRNPIYRPNNSTGTMYERTTTGWMSLRARVLCFHSQGLLASLSLSFSLFPPRSGCCWVCDFVYPVLPPARPSLVVLWWVLMLLYCCVCRVWRHSVRERERSSSSFWLRSLGPARANLLGCPTKRKVPPTQRMGRAKQSSRERIEILEATTREIGERERRMRREGGERERRSESALLLVYVCDALWRRRRAGGYRPPGGRHMHGRGVEKAKL